MRFHWIVVVLACACSREARPRPAAQVQRTNEFIGMCDASGAVELGDKRFVIADDEDNVLRIYDIERGGAAVGSVDIGPKLELELVGDDHPRYPETDLEAATIVGDRALWITSHARSSRGVAQPERLRMFATTVSDQPEIAGKVYTNLVADLLAEPKLAQFGLAQAIELAPKAPGGFNIEGMTAMPDGGVLIGLRNPVPNNRAVLVPLANPLEVLEGNRPRFGDPVVLDLGGRGVRALSVWRGLYVIAAGSPTDSRVLKPALYTWDGHGAAKLVAADLGTLNPEAFFTPDQLDSIVIFSDDGTALVDGVACKELTDSAKKSFRAAWVQIAMP